MYVGAVAAVDIIPRVAFVTGLRSTRSRGRRQRVVHCYGGGVILWEKKTTIKTLYRTSAYILYPSNVRRVGGWDKVSRWDRRARACNRRCAHYDSLYPDPGSGLWTCTAVGSDLPGRRQWASRRESSSESRARARPTGKHNAYQSAGGGTGGGVWQCGKGRLTARLCRTWKNCRRPRGRTHTVRTTEVRVERLTDSTSEPCVSCPRKSGLQEE